MTVSRGSFLLRPEILIGEGRAGRDLDQDHRVVSALVACVARGGEVSVGLGKGGVSLALIAASSAASSCLTVDAIASGIDRLPCFGTSLAMSSNVSVNSPSW